VFSFLESFSFGASKQKSKRDSLSIDTCSDFGLSKERVDFDCGSLVFTYLDFSSLGANKQKSKRDSASIDTCTHFGKSKESFVFSKTNPPAESMLLIWFRLFIWRK